MATMGDRHLSKKAQNALQFIKFTLFSASAGIIQAVSFTLLFELARLPYWPAYLIALVLSVVYNFTINRRLTFRSVTNYPLAMLKVLGYYAVFTPLSTWWGDRLTGIGWNDYLVLAGTMLINFITEFLFCRFVVYHNSINSIDKKPADIGKPSQPGA
jgi:putative flippase GtrA